MRIPIYDDGMAVLGAGFDFGGFFGGLAQSAQAGIDYAQKQKAEKQAAQAAADKVGAVTKADAYAAQLSAQALLSAEQAQAAGVAAAASPTDSAKAALRDTASRKAQADLLAAQQAMQMANTTAMGPPDVTAQRVAAAQAAALAAAEQAQKSPTRENILRAQAWQEMVTRAMSGQITGQRPLTPDEQAAAQAALVKIQNVEGSFLTRKVLGIPAWGWGAGVLGLGTGAVLLLRRR